jgi:hypothetical protein
MGWEINVAAARDGRQSSPVGSRRLAFGASAGLVGAFIVLYAVSYPLGDWIVATANHLLVPGPAELGFLVLAAMGLSVVIAWRRHLLWRDVGLAFGLAMPVWLAIQARYWANGWTPYIPYYDPTLHAVETALMVLGASVLVRRRQVLPFPTAEGRYRAACRGIAVGLSVGVALAAVNVALFAVQGASPSTAGLPAALPSAALEALKPAVLEEAAYRLLLMGLVIAALRPRLGYGDAALVAIALSAVFHSALHVPDLFLSAPLAALGFTAVTALLFGVPLAVLAYRRGVESSIAGHWMVDAVRFSLGL